MIVNASSSDKQSDSSGRSEQGSERNDTHYNNQGFSVAVPVKKGATPSKTAIANSQTYTEQPNQYQVDELAAQETMAITSVIMAAAAIATFLVTTFGTVLIWTQVKLTRKAVEETGDATKAMKIANEIAQRPHIKMRRFYIVGEVPAKAGDTLRIRIEATNWGTSAAMITGHHIGLATQWPLPPSQDYWDDPSLINRLSFGEGGNALAAGGTNIPFADFVVTEEQFRALYKNQLSVLGFISYTDQSGKRLFHTDFARCFKSGRFEPSPDPDYESAP